MRNIPTNESWTDYFYVLMNCFLLLSYVDHPKQTKIRELKLRKQQIFIPNMQYWNERFSFLQKTSSDVAAPHDDEHRSCSEDTGACLQLPSGTDKRTRTRFLFPARSQTVVWYLRRSFVPLTSLKTAEWKWRHPPVSHRKTNLKRWFNL